MPTSRRRRVTLHNKKDQRGLRDKTNPLWCAACSILCDSKINFEQHLQTQLHEHNYAVFTFEKHRKRKIQNRHKVLVRTKCKDEWIDPDNTGSLQTQILPDVKTFDYKFELLNQGDTPIELCSIVLLHPYPVFVVSDEHEVFSKGNVVRIQPACCYSVQVQFTNHGRGTYGVPVCFKFIRTKDGEKKDFDVVRVIVVKVRSSKYPAMEPEESPFRGDMWTDVKYRVDGATLRGKPLKFETPWEIPEEYHKLLEHWLVPWGDITRDEMDLLTSILDIAIRGYENFDLETYEFIMHMLLYLEEYDALSYVNRYNMRGVTLRTSIIPERLELKVPGLAEKRPSLLKNDLIYCRVRREDGRTEDVEYEGQIVEVMDESIIISHFNQVFYHRFYSGNLQLDVRFSFSRYPISVMHSAVNNVVQKEMNYIIFPECSKVASSLLKPDVKLQFHNKGVESNEEQRQAVLNIVKGVCRPAPYIIFGPPGTGKTVTIVESILQIRKVFPQSKILVCAPSNAACDHVATRLVPHFKTNELLRYHSSNREWSTVPEVLHSYSNRDEHMYYSPTPQDLKKYRVVVCTLISANKLSNNKEHNQNGTPKVAFSHIFIDECGQAREPEALVPIGVALSKFVPKSPSGMVVLAGDPCQLGPVCNSKRAENIAVGIFSEEELNADSNDVTRLNRRMGLGISLLERLMVTCSLYQKDVDGCYDNQYITKLLQNFRSHPDIIDLPNKLFYSGELIPACSDAVRSDPVREKVLPSHKPKLSCTVLFHGVIGQEKREGRSPSYFNLYETDQVMNYVHLLLNTRKKEIKVEPSDIGIIAPYIRQVYKIKHSLKQKKLEEVEVGTTETFQGREKRVMIISTVRANRNLLDYDYRFQLGFVADPKRFNVAVTRAQSLLIVVGNPYQLVNDPNWKQLIEFCKSNGSYVGSSYKPRNETWWNHVVGKVNELSIKD